MLLRICQRTGLLVGDYESEWVEGWGLKVPGLLL